MAVQKLGTAELLFTCAQQMGLAPVWLTPLGVFAILVDGQERYINFARSPLNSATSASLANDKYVTRCILERHHMQNIPYMLPGTLSEANAFLGKYGTVIAKPVSGAGARDVHIITDTTQLAALQVDQYLLEKYIVGTEIRYLVLNDQVVGVHQSEYGTSVAEDRLLQRHSHPKEAWNPSLIEASRRVANMLDLHFAAVDYLIEDTGQTYILEVNTRPGFKWFHAPSSGPVIDIARLFLETLVDAIRSKKQVLPKVLPTTFDTNHNRKHTTNNELRRSYVKR